MHFPWGHLCTHLYPCINSGTFMNNRTHTTFGPSIHQLSRQEILSCCLLEQVRFRVENVSLTWNWTQWNTTRGVEVNTCTSHLLPAFVPSRTISVNTETRARHFKLLVSVTQSQLFKVSVGKMCKSQVFVLGEFNFCN